MKFRRTLVATAVAAALLLTGCSGGGTSNGSVAASTTLTLAQEIEPQSFDPAFAFEGDMPQYYQPVYDSLIRRMPDGEYVPMLATSWEYSDDNLVLSLELRDDVTFTDGAAFDAEAAKANLEHFKNGGGAQAFWLTRMESVEVTGDHSIAIHLTEPEPALINYLSGAAGYMGSPAELGTDAMKTMPVGTGPYTLDASATSVGSQYTYIKNEDYWDPSLQHYDKIVIKVIGDVTARVNALISGQVDAARVDPKSMTQVEGAGLVPHLQDLDYFGITLLDRAGQLSPALGDVRIRQAINYAIDKETILEQIYLDAGTPTAQIFSTDSTAYEKELDDAYPYDPEKAKALVQESGIKDPSFSLALLSTVDPALKAVLKEQLAAVGITVDITELAPADAWDIVSGDYSSFVYSLNAPSTWVAVNQYLSPNSATNALHYEDPKVNELAHEIQFGDEDTAAAKAKELNEYIVDQAWFAPWFRAAIPYYANKKVDVELQIEQGMPSIWNYQPAE
ncbi:MAG: ABC transporter substrate-binding protein [Microbacterium sp.]